MRVINTATRHTGAAFEKDIRSDHQECVIGNSCKACVVSAVRKRAVAVFFGVVCASEEGSGAVQGQR